MCLKWWMKHHFVLPVGHSHRRLHSWFIWEENVLNNEWKLLNEGTQQGWHVVRSSPETGGKGISGAWGGSLGRRWSGSLQWGVGKGAGQREAERIDLWGGSMWTSDTGSDSEGSGDESCQAVVPEPGRELESTREARHAWGSQRMTGVLIERVSAAWEITYWKSPVSCSSAQNSPILPKELRTDTVFFRIRKMWEISVFYNLPFFVACPHKKWKWNSKIKHILVSSTYSVSWIMQRFASLGLSLDMCGPPCCVGCWGRVSGAEGREIASENCGYGRGVTIQRSRAASGIGPSVSRPSSALSTWVLLSSAGNLGQGHLEFNYLILLAVQAPDHCMISQISAGSI